MALRPKGDHPAADSSAVATHGQRQSSSLIKHTSSAKKGQDLALLATYLRRTQPDLAPLRELLRGSFRNQTAIKRILEDTDVFVRLGTFRNEHSRSVVALRRALADLHNQYAGIAARTSYPPLQRERLQRSIALRSRRLGKPLIEQIKAPMTAEQAQAISERLSAEDGPRRKLPPLP
ncbi:hypothetical protein ACIQU3_17025 [Streptomyces sp. NPDC101110]|uniref:hypothetical protein n=1 Tax=Streptomyces sp. NPDC101110 TaxID=3366104 RepID=UPI00380BDBC4